MNVGGQEMSKTLSQEDEAFLIWLNEHPFIPLEDLLLSLRTREKASVAVLFAIFTYYLVINILDISNGITESITQNVQAVCFGLAYSLVSYLILQDLYRRALIRIAEAVLPTHRQPFFESAKRHVMHVRRLKTVALVSFVIVTFGTLGFFIIVFDIGPPIIQTVIQTVTTLNSNDDWLSKSNWFLHGSIILFLGILLVLSISFFCRFMILHIIFIDEVSMIPTINSIYVTNRAFDKVSNFGTMNAILCVLGTFLCAAIGDIEIDGLALALVIVVFMTVLIATMLPIARYGLRLDRVRKKLADILTSRIRRLDDISYEGIEFEVAVLDYILRQEDHGRFFNMAMRRAALLLLHASVSVGLLWLEPAFRELLRGSG